MSTRLSRPLPDRVTVSAQPLAQIINALNGPAHYIRELQVTRGPLFANPIDVIERELLEAQAAPAANDTSVSELDIQGELHNHQRVGGPSLAQVMEIINRHITCHTFPKAASVELKQLFEGNDRAPL